MWNKVFIILFIVPILTVALFGMQAGVISHATNEMSHCLFHMVSGISGMNLGDHIANWRGSVTGVISLELPSLLFALFSLLLVSCILFFARIELHFLSSPRVKEREGKPPKIFEYLSLLFAEGILHSKAY